MSTDETDETQVQPTASASASTVSTNLSAEVEQLVDDHWPIFGDEWQIQRARAQRDAFKTSLAIIINK